MPAKRTAKKTPKAKAGIDTPNPKGRGRPSSYTPNLADEICQRLSEGEPLAVMCRDTHMPGVQTVYDWMDSRAEFSVAYASARARGIDAIAADCLAIADDERHDWRMTQKGVITDEVAIGRARLQVDTRLKLLAKWDPKRYGDNASLKVDQTNRVAPMDDEQFEEELRKSPSMRAEFAKLLAKTGGE